MKECTHLEMIQEVTPNTKGCEECLQSGGWWVHLRVCVTCGHVGCCDASPGKHATRHYRETGHPLAQSIEPGENWIWCFEDRVMID